MLFITFIKGIKHYVNNINMKVPLEICLICDRDWAF